MTRPNLRGSIECAKNVTNYIASRTFTRPAGESSSTPFVVIFPIGFNLISISTHWRVSLDPCAKRALSPAGQLVGWSLAVSLSAAQPLDRLACSVVVLEAGTSLKDTRIASIYLAALVSCLWTSLSSHSLCFSPLALQLERCRSGAGAGSGRLVRACNWSCCATC